MKVVYAEKDVRSIMTRSNLPVSDYSINPYVGCAHACKYCYASFMKRFSNHREPWGAFVDVKYWPEIRKPEKYAGKEAFIGSVTDAYQPCEEKYCRTRELLEQFQGSGIAISIATKSDLVMRDLDLIGSFPDARVAWSINTLDEDFRKEMDSGVSIARRLSAMRRFHDAGIQTVCFVSPIFPGITEVGAIIERVKDQCNAVWLENLNLRGDYRATVFRWIHERHPELDGLYQAIYSEGDRTYWDFLEQEIREYAGNEGLPYRRAFDHSPSESGRLPVVVNFFYHEAIKRSAKKKSG